MTAARPPSRRRSTLARACAVVLEYGGTQNRGSEHMTRRTVARRLRILTSLVGLLVGTAASAADVHVMISAGFFQAYSELVPAFEKKSGHRVVTTGASIDELGRQGLVRGDSKVDLARSEIGMVVRAGAPKPDIGTVDALRKVLLDARSIAYSDSASGIYLSTVLFARLGVADQVAGKSRKVRGPPSGEQVAAVVARGDAEIGFQQVSELIHVPGTTFVAPIPRELQQETFYSAALATAVTQAEAAQALIRFLSSPEAAPAIVKAGLAPMAAR